MERKKVLFICTHNSARSQMAEGLLRARYGDSYKAYSAGVQATEVRSGAIKVMKEINIDISHHRSKSIEEFQNTMFDVVVTVCDHANETCPFFPGKRHLHKGFQDPSECTGDEEEILGCFRRVRDEIEEWVMAFFGNKDYKESI